MALVAITVSNQLGFLTKEEIKAGKFGVFLCDTGPEEYTGDCDKRVGIFSSPEEADDFARVLHEAMPNVSVLYTL